MTIGDKKEFEPVLSDSTLNWRHFHQPQELVAPLDRSLQANDLLLVKGDRNEKTFLLPDGLRQRSREHFYQGPDAVAPETIRAELHPLTPAELPRVKEALARGGSTGWAFSVPFMLAVDRSSKRTSLLWQEVEGSISIFVLREGERPRLDLYAPPFPANPEALRRSLEIANRHNRDHSAKIYWIDEKDAAMVAAQPGLQVRRKLQEYLYCPDDFAQLSGTRFCDFRRNLRLAKTLSGLEARPYLPEDADDCLALLEHWERNQGKKYESLRDRSFTRACFELAPLLSDNDLRGEIFLVEGKTRGFAFGGEIRPGLGSFLVRKASPELRGLSYFIFLNFLRTFSDCALVNDGSDMESDGLRQHKAHLRPCGMHSMFKARQDRL